MSVGRCALVAVLVGCGSPAANQDAAIDAPIADAPIVDAAPDACVPTVTPVPVGRRADVVWVGDNSSSMGTALAQLESHLDAFVALLDARGIDSRTILLSLRGKGLTDVGGSMRYAVCIPGPLAGDDDCGDGTRFFHRSVDMRSTQALEQVLGTLGQTTGYTEGEARGGPAWANLLRPGSSPSIVIVSDDNARLSATDFETFAGGKNPFNAYTLPPGLLDPSWAGLFDGYAMSGVYGWGSETDPAVMCTFADMTRPASSGPTYTTLVTSTGGVRAPICDGAAAWDAFIVALADDIAKHRAGCDLALSGPLAPGPVDVRIGSTPVVRVTDASGCTADNGWYYDDPSAPTSIVLCPAACDLARTTLAPVEVGVERGCSTP